MAQNKYERPNNTDSTANYTADIDNGFEVFERGAGSMFQCHAQDTPNMTVRLEAGTIWEGSGNAPTEVAAQNSGTIVAPSSNPRIDRITVLASSGAISVITGAEAASPSAPAMTSGRIPIAQVTLQTSSTEITNAMIVDERPSAIVNISGGGSGISSVGADSTPQLGGDLDVNSNEIVSVSGGDIAIHSDNEIIMTLGDTAGSDTVSIRDSANSVVASINSDGDIACTDLTCTALTASSLVLSAGATITAFLDEDDMASNSATVGCTQQSIKAYVDANGGGGAWTLIETQDVTSPVATVDFETSIDGTYDTYALVLSQVRPSTDNSGLRLRVGTGGTPTYQTSGYVGTIFGYRTTNVIVDAAPTTYIGLTHGTYPLGSAADDTYQAVLYIGHPADGYCVVHGTFGQYDDGVSTITPGVLGGMYRAATAVTALRLYASSGNIAEGRFTLFGIKHT